MLSRLLSAGDLAPRTDNLSLAEALLLDFSAKLASSPLILYKSLVRKQQRSGENRKLLWLRYGGMEVVVILGQAKDDLQPALAGLDRT